MVSEALDVSRWLFTNQDYQIPSGFKGPYICWAVLWICGLTIIFRIIVWLPCKHSETWDPKISSFTIIKVTDYSNVPWTFLHCFLNEGGNTWTRGEFGQFAEFSWKYLFKVPKPRYPCDANSREKESLNSSTQAKPEEQLEEQHRQGAGVQSYLVIT